MNETTRIVVGITGASGAIYGIRLLEILKEVKIETHLVISKWGSKIIEYETDSKIDEVKNLASYCYEDDDLGSNLSSGSFLIDGVVICPCSMKTVAAVKSGISSTLLTRSADVALKEGRKLILVIRETPLNSIHLKNLFDLSGIGVTILPAMPSYYNRPRSIQQLVDNVVGKILDQLWIKHNIYQRWKN